jgi:uncharacterized protein YjbJ (UPF0337 family)
MGADDKLQNKGKETKGTAKEAVGTVTGNEGLKAKGRDEQGQAKAKEAKRHAKESAKSVKDALKPKG